MEGKEKGRKKKKEIDRSADEFYFQNMTRAFGYSYFKVGLYHIGNVFITISFCEYVELTLMMKMNVEWYIVYFAGHV